MATREQEAQAQAERLYTNGVLTNKAQIETVVRELTRDPVAWIVTVESSGLSADRDDRYVVVDFHEDGAKELAQRAHRDEYPMYTVERMEAYRVSPNVRAIGRLATDD